jgi:glycosyltransferase 2 family protein
MPPGLGVKNRLDPMTCAGSKNPARPSRLTLVFKVACGAAILAMLFVVVDRDALRQVLSQLNIWVFLSLPVFYVHTAVKAVRWRCFLASQQVDISFLQANRLYLSGTFLGLVTPGRLGEVYRAWGLKREKGVNPGLGLASVLVDRLADLAVLLSLGTLGLLYLVHQGYGATSPAIAAPLFWSRIRKRIRPVLRRQFRALAHRMPGAIADEIPAAYRHFVGSLRGMPPLLFLKILALTLLSVAIYCGHLYFIARVLGLPLSFFEVVGVLSAATFINLIPISINGIGTRDAFLVATLPLLGVGRAEAFGFALVFLLLFLANTLMAMPFWLYGKKKDPKDRNDD